MAVNIGMLAHTTDKHGPDPTRKRFSYIFQILYFLYPEPSLTNKCRFNRRTWTRISTKRTIIVAFDARSRSCGEGENDVRLGCLRHLETQTQNDLQHDIYSLQ